MPITLTTTVASAAGISWGWDATLDLGTTGDFYVDAATGDNGNPGTSTGAAFETIQAGVDAANSAGGGTVKVIGDGVKYRENVTMKSGADNANRVIVEGYGTDKPILTAGEPLTGWTACVSGDSSVVGSNWANIYKKTGVAKSSFVSTDVPFTTEPDPLNMNLFEDNEQLQMCIAWAGGDIADKFFFGNYLDYFTADSFNTSSGKILSVVDSSVTGTYTAAQIEEAYALLFTTSNNVGLDPVSSVSGSTITLTNQNINYETNGSAFAEDYALLNLLPAIQQGQFGFVDNGTTVDIYVWPNDSANITSGIEYCARPQCIEAFNASNWTVRGLKFQQTAGYNNTRAGAFILKPTNIGKTSNATIEHCYFYGKWGIDAGRGAAGIFLTDIDALKIHNCTLERMQGSFGVFMNGDVNDPLNTTVPAENLDFQQNYAIRTGASAWRFFAQETAVVAHNKAELCGFEAHSNKINFYEQCHKFLVWGNIFPDTDGYCAFQEASRGYWLFNHSIGTRNPGGNNHRTWVDQNHSTSPPASYNGETGASLIANNTFLPQPTVFANGTDDAFQITPDPTNDAANSDVTYSVYNNLYHGHSVRSSARIDAWTDNWNSAADGNFTTGNTTFTDTDVYTDPDNGDFTIKAGASLRSATGKSLASEITAMQAIFTQFDNWNLDALGNPFTNTAPPVGCVEGYDYTDLAWSAEYLVT